MAAISNGIITTAGIKVASDLMSNSSPTNWMLYIAYGKGSYGSQKEWGNVSTGDWWPLRDAAARTMLAQDFKVDANTAVSSMKLALKKYCLWDVYRWLCPSGNVWVEIHSSRTGTSGTKNASTNIVGQASDNVNLSNIWQSYEWIEFTFSGTKPYLTADTTYYIVIYGDFTVDSDKCLGWTYKSAGGYDDGQAWHINSSMAWDDQAGDLSFKVYGYGEVTPSKFDTTLTDEVDRELATVVDTTARVNLSKQFTIASAVTIMEVGVFDTDSGGNMVYRGALGSSNKIVAAAADDVTIGVILTPEQG